MRCIECGVLLCGGALCSASSCCDVNVTLVAVPSRRRCAVFVCFIAIVTGLFATLILLAIFQKALPALPISIFLGITFFFLAKAFVLPYVTIMAANAVFV